MYSPEIIAETATLGKALITGAVLGIYYDVFRIIRRIAPCNYANILTQDLFFWTTSAVVVFFVTIKLNGGVVRYIFIAAVLGGWAFYMLTLGSLVMAATGFIIRMGRKFLAGLHNKCVLPIVKSIKKFCVKQKTEKSVEFDNNFSNIA